MRRHKDDFDRLNADHQSPQCAHHRLPGTGAPALAAGPGLAEPGHARSRRHRPVAAEAREPVAVPDDDETDLGLPRPRHGRADARRNGDPPEGASAPGGRHRRRRRCLSHETLVAGRAPSAARAKNGPVARDRPDAAPARGQPAGAATTGRDPARPSMGEPRTAPASNRPSTLECQPRPTPTGPDPAVRKRRGGGEMQ